MVEIADAAAIAPSIEAVAASKLQVDARNWIATKQRPQKYGDRIEVQQKAPVSIRIGPTPNLSRCRSPIGSTPVQHSRAKRLGMRLQPHRTPKTWAEPDGGQEILR